MHLLYTTFVLFIITTCCILKIQGQCNEQCLTCPQMLNYTQLIATITNLAFTHLGYEETNDIVNLMPTLATDSFELYVGTLTGGNGNAFNPKDTQGLYYMYKNIVIPGLVGVENILVSTTFGCNSVVYEYISSFIHNETTYLMLPNLPITHKTVTVLQALIINFTSDGHFISEENVWDQAGVLHDLGFIPKYSWYGKGCKHLEDYDDDSDNWETTEEAKSLLKGKDHLKHCKRVRLPVVSAREVVEKRLDLTNPKIKFNQLYKNHHQQEVDVNE